MKVRVVYKEDGSVSVINPAPNSRQDGELESQWYDRVFSKAMLSSDFQGLDYDDIDDQDLPSDRKYRNSWRGLKGNPVLEDVLEKDKIDQDVLIQERIFNNRKSKERKEAVGELKEEGKVSSEVN